MSKLEIGGDNGLLHCDYGPAVIYEDGGRE
jgi:hypothetical protein